MNDPDAAFCVEGGIVIHNCLRYRLADMDALPVEAIRRPAPGTVAHTIAEFKKADKKPRRRDNTSRLADLQRSVPRLAAFYRAR